MATTSQPLRPVVATVLTFADLRAALAAGWRDFLGNPLYGLFFGAVYVVTGLAVAYALFYRGEVGWLVPVTAGFPLIAPFAAVGLYEVSRRRELGEQITWGAVLGALRGRGTNNC